MNIVKRDVNSSISSRFINQLIDICPSAKGQEYGIHKIMQFGMLHAYSHSLGPMAVASLTAVDRVHVMPLIADGLVP